MKQPAVFFDRDNTLIISDGYLGDPDQVVLVEGAAAAVAEARRLGFVVVTLSNQSGVARGLFDEDAVHAVNQRLDALLQHANPQARIARHEFCPFHPEGTVERYAIESDLRKPKPGMLLRAAEAMGLDLSLSWVIGDAGRDIEAGRAAGCKTILFTAPGLPASPATEENAKVKPDFTASSLVEAVQIIARHMPRPVAPAGPSLTKLESMVQQILEETKRRNTEPAAEFSLSKLFAGIAQVMSLALVFVAFLNREKPEAHQHLLFALFFQALTIALLLMGKQR